MKVEEINEKIKELRTEREKIIRARTVTIGKLLDLNKELEEKAGDIQWRIAYRLEQVLEKLGESEDAA